MLAWLHCVMMFLHCAKIIMLCNYGMLMYCHWIHTSDAKWVGLSLCKGFPLLYLSCTDLIVHNQLLPFSKSYGSVRVAKQYVSYWCVWCHDNYHIQNKGTGADCGNYRGISLLSVAGKIIACIILNRLILTFSGESLFDSQCRLCPNQSTVDMIFTVRQVQEKCLEQNVSLCSVFIDLMKAFETVNRNTLWTILRKLGSPWSSPHSNSCFTMTWWKRYS